MIKEIYIWTNGMIMAFNEYGEQEPKCQGFLFERRVSDNIKKMADKNTQFYFGNWADKTKDKVNFSWYFIRR